MVQTMNRDWGVSSYSPVASGATYTYLVPRWKGAEKNGVLETAPIAFWHVGSSFLSFDVTLLFKTHSWPPSPAAFLRSLLRKLSNCDCIADCPNYQRRQSSPALVCFSLGVSDRRLPAVLCMFVRPMRFDRPEKISNDQGAILEDFISHKSVTFRIFLDFPWGPTSCQSARIHNAGYQERHL